jgi:hypothetical protein
VFLKLIALLGKIVAWGFLALVIGLAALGGYFYDKSGRPMQVAQAQRIAPGITYREFWRDRLQRWREIDERKAAQGKGRSCVITSLLMLPVMYAGSIYEVNYLRMHRGTKETAAFLKSINNIMPPDELIYGSWWQLPAAWWWQIENMSWWDYYRPLARAAYCEAGVPHRPAAQPAPKSIPTWAVSIPMPDRTTCPFFATSPFGSFFR